MYDSDLKWLGVLLAGLVILLIVAVVMLANSNVVCEINPLDASDIVCYEPE